MTGDISRGADYIVVWGTNEFFCLVTYLGASFLG